MGGLTIPMCGCRKNVWHDVNRLDEWIQRYVATLPLAAEE